MKLTTIALSLLLMLSSTLALAAGAYRVALTALEEPAPAGPPVAPPAAVASLEPPACCASASVELSISNKDKAIVVSFMGCPFLEVRQPTHLFERSN